MVRISGVSLPLAVAGASAAVLATVSQGFTLTVTNACSSDIELYTREGSVYSDAHETVPVGGSVQKTIAKGFEGHFRNGSDDAATLAEFATKGDMDLTWFDISIIPPRLHPGFVYCMSLEECKANSDSGIGYNTPMSITPQSNTNGANCRELDCLADSCDDAYNYPTDDTKTHSCAMDTDFVLTFCPSGDSASQVVDDVASQVADTEAPETEAPETEAPETDNTETVPPEPKPQVTEVPVTEAPEMETVVPETEAPETDAPVQVADEADIAPEATEAATAKPAKGKHCV